MLFKSMRSVALVWRAAPLLTAVKLLQLALSATMTPLSIYFTQRIIDAVSGVVTLGDGWGRIIPWVSLLLIALFFASGAGFLNGILYISIRRKVNAHMTPAILYKFRNLDYACFEDSEVRDTLERMSSDPQYQILELFLTVTGACAHAVMMVGATLIFAQAGWWFPVGFAVLLVPMVWLDFKVSDAMNAMMTGQSADERRMRYLGGLLSGKSPLFELKAFRATRYVSEKLRNLALDVMETRIKFTIRAQRYNLLSTILFKCWSFFIVISLVASIVRGDVTIGLFTALIMSTGAVMGNAETLSHTMQQMRRRYLLIGHYQRFMGLPEVTPGGEALPAGPPRIAFEDVTFAYPNAELDVLKGVSITVDPGERVALVGENGAGKSTVVKLLCRLYRPDGGRILINGADIWGLDAAGPRRAFSIVFQDYCKYELTLRENVAFGDLSKLRDDGALRGALRMGMADGIAELDAPLGKLEEEGVDVSGGQWQRIALARACLPESAFVILDEPTASLDPLAESRMYRSFAEVLKSRGCLMVSHRLASARMADRIVVLSGGAVAETGDHDSLMAADALYARMYRAQSAWYAKEGGEVAGQTRNDGRGRDCFVANRLLAMTDESGVAGQARNDPGSGPVAGEGSGPA